MDNTQDTSPASNEFETLIEPEASLRRAARQMIDHRIGGLPVVASGALVGIITETDIFRVFAQQPSLGGWDE